MPRPNILLILTDDHAGWCMRCAGNPVVGTPNMDYLADQGAYFQGATTNCPVCSPARASLWTGTIPSWHGVHDHLNSCGHPGIGDQATLADALQRAGYLTALIGKWHCHTSEDNSPKRGFGRWFSQYAGTNSRFGAQPFWDQDTRVDYHGYQAPIITEQTCAFLRQAAAADAPFFCAVGYTDTHRPFQDAPSRITARHEGHVFDEIPNETLTPSHGSATLPLSRDSQAGRAALTEYYAAVTMIDQQVGRLLDQLVSLGILNETLVIYTADHGLCVGHHGLAGKGNSTTPQNFLHESLTVPLIAYWPGRIRGGVVSRATVTHTDTFCTLTEVAGVSHPDNAPRPGKSWFPLALGEEILWRDQLIAEYGNARMIQRDRHKLIRRFPGPNGSFPDEFYDLQADPRETTNIIQEADTLVLQDLDARLGDFFANYSRPEADGRTVGDRGLHNSKEPWRVSP